MVNNSFSMKFLKNQRQYQFETYPAPIKTPQITSQTVYPAHSSYKQHKLPYRDFYRTFHYTHRYSVRSIFCSSPTPHNPMGMKSSPPKQGLSVSMAGSVEDSGAGLLCPLPSPPPLLLLTLQSRDSHDHVTLMIIPREAARRHSANQPR